MENISLKNIEDILALSSLQEGMLFHYLKEPISDLYFEQLCLEISGKIDVNTFERAWNTVIETNEMLRTVFRWEKIEKPSQIILKKHKFKAIFRDLSNEVSNKKQTALEEIKNKNRLETFDLNQVPFRVILCKKEEAKYEVVISNHHILYDGWSTGIILKEFFEAYHKLRQAEQLIKPFIKPSFKEYIKWIQVQDKKKQEQYWREYLEGFETSTELPIKKRGKAEEKGDVENYSQQIEKEVREKLEQFVNRNRITIATVFNSAWGIVLQHYCNTEDVLFGVTVSGRNIGIKGIEEMVGLFINTIPLRVKTSEEEKLIELVSGIERESHAREEFEHTPLSEIRKYSELFGVESLFETLVALENYPLDNRLNSPNSPLKIESYSIIEKTHYDIAIGIMIAEEITVNIYYNTGIYERETIGRLAGHFNRIVRQILDNPEEKVSRLEIVSEEEKARILHDFNDQGIQYPGDKTIHELFRGQAEKTPDCISVVGATTCFPVGCPVSLTYKKLNEQSDNLAQELIEKGVLPGAIVGIQVERSIEMIVGILGILKTGAAYLPLNPKNPQERTDFMLKDAGARIIVGDRHACSSQPLNFSTSQLLISMSSVAYIIYTSGSTGNPKGVPIMHANFCPLMHWGYKHLGLTTEDRSVQNLSYYFDWSVWEIFIALTSGASLYMVSNEIILDTERYIDFIERNRVTVLHITPTHFQTLIHRERKLNTLRHLCIGAEKLTVDLVKRSYEIVNETCRVYNMYGPTEATIMAAVLEIERTDFSNYKELTSVPIGKTLGNNVLYVLDRNLNVSPLNIPGELYIGGEGVASGYLNNPELTSQKFLDVQKPFFKKVFGRRRHLYKTGDLARWLNDGTVEYLGRIDQQVKIRGYRIEPGEIENRLLEHESVKDVIVVCRQYKTGENYLSAYVVYHPDRSTCTSNNLKDYLSSRLPDYMVPSYIMKLERMPLNPNGKVDKKALPDPGITAVGAYVAARNKLEKSLVDTWGRVLGIDTGRIGIDDDFFELGGHSLNVTSLIGRIHKELKIEIPFTEIFVSPTIRELASYIEQKEESHYGEIPQTEEKEYYPLSPSQKRMYLLHQMDSDSIVYNIHGVMRIEGEVDPEKFENVFLKLIERHESLRTSFEIVDEEPVQRIHSEVDFKIMNLPLSEVFVLPRGCNPLFQKGRFNLSKAPLLRVGLKKQEKERYLLVIEMSHIISDGVSVKALIHDFSDLYVGKKLIEIPFQYKDYAEWRRREKGDLREQGEFWKKEFEGEIPVLELPTDYSRPAIQSFEGNSLDFEISGAITGTLKKLAFETGTTLYMILLGIYTIFLSKISGQEDIVVGTPVAGRRHPDLENIIGMFVNTLALRNNLSREKTFIDFLYDVKEKTLKALENQDYQYEELVEQLTVNRDISRNPLFDTMLVQQNTGMQDIVIPGLKLVKYDYEHKTSKFDLTLIAAEAADTHLFTFEYCAKLFKQETIERFINYFKKLIISVTESKERRIFEIEIITEDEKNRILYDFNNTAREYPKDKTIHRLFEEQLEKTPDYIALVGVAPCYPSSLTYRELNKKSNSMAHELIEKRIEPGDIVGIQIERSIEMVIGILGILKSGAAYLPIDPSYPQERIDYMLKDSGAKWLVTNNDLEELPNFRLLPATGNWQPATSLAYIIYTSGSTGKPKGVMVEHQSVVNLLYALQMEYPFTSSDVYLFKTSYIFDVSVAELFGWYMGGGRVAVLEKDGHKDPRVIMDWIERYIVTHINFVPSMFNSLIEYVTEENKSRLSSLKYIFLAGEALLPELVTKFRELKTAIKLENIYGPTEGTVYSSRYTLSEWDGEGSILIGKPIPNIELYIYDINNKLQPIGIHGELCISGIGLAKGYLNRPELTSERFISFAINNPKPKIQNPKLYRTGDLVRWLDDGNIEYLGRIDRQVKVRGYRIELGEIENELSKHEEIKEAVVIAREIEKGNNSICAYIVSWRELGVSELREYLGKRLPEYMIPAYFVQVDKIPLTHSGKVDRRALPASEIKEIGRYAAPRDAIEKKLVEIWSEILFRDKAHLSPSIGIDDNFFHLGGHSLKATILVSKIHKNFNINLSLEEVFKRPTICDLSKYIREAVDVEYKAIEKSEAKEYYTLSSSQKRLHFLNRMDKCGTSYNMSAAWILEGKIDRNGLEDAFSKLIKKHESLRTTFEMIEEEPVQRIHDNVEFKIEYLATEDTENTERGPRPFDFSKAPLMRVELIKVEEEKYILMVDIHHIISDGMSVQVLAHDFSVLYVGEGLAENRLQYRDYAEWQKGAKGSESLLSQEVYWIGEFEGEIPVLDLPVDYIRPVIQSFEGDRINFEICRETTESLKTIILETGTTLYMVLLGIYTILLSKVSGQEDIIIGTPVAGRRHADLEGIIGMFVNTLALKNNPSGKKKFIDFLNEVKEKTLQALENQDYQYEELVEQLSVNRDISRNPLFDTVFALQNTSLREIEIPGLKLTPYEYENKTSKFDLTLIGEEEAETLLFTLEYSTKLFKKETIERFIEYFKKIVNDVTENKESRICDIEIITEEEKNRILTDFNNTAREYPKDKAIHWLFKDKVGQTPDYIAVVDRTTQMTYGELDEKSDSLAHELIKKGTEHEAVVGIKIERSVEMIIVILGILKAGAAYMPVGMEYPQERIDYMIKDSGAKLLVTANNLEEVKNPPTKSFCPAFYKKRAAGGISIAYIIYTSGSTGRPKGVMVIHRNVIRLIKNTNFVHFETDDRILQTGALEFDASTFEIWGVLLNGLSLYLIEKERILHPERLRKSITNNRITTMWLTSPLFNQLAQSDERIFSGLRNLIVGGDVLSPRHINRAKRKFPGLNIINGYGPTENTTFSATYLIEKEYEEKIPIGKPIANSTAYIIDKSGALQPIGITGELLVGGDGVSMGYMNNPELTAERFIARDTNTLYCTGDLAKWLEDGNIEFIGRMDQQVKIRGFRIEPGEIEQHLLKYVGIRDVVVRVKKGTGEEKYLCAYFVSDEIISVSEIREFLLKNLPDYMVPSYFIRLDKIPLTSNGKADWRKLPEPEIKFGEYYTAPGNRIEEKLVEIWSEILGVNKDKISVHSNFFELGGHSLKATLLVSKIHKELNVILSLTEVFRKPTIKGLAGHILGASLDDYASIEPVEEKQYYDLSHAQKRIWILDRVEKDLIAYNMPGQIELGKLNRGALKKTVETIVKRHEILRTTFINVNGEPKQRVHTYEKIDFNINYIDLRSEENGEAIIKTLIEKEKNTAFNLETGPLLRIRLLHIEEDRYLFLFTMHHIVSDGWSMEILAKEFMTLYDAYANDNGNPLPSLLIQYKDYSQWHNNQLSGKNLEKHRNYWLNRFSGEIPILKLPTDYLRPELRSFTGEFILFSLSQDVTQQLKLISREFDTTLFITLLAVMNVFLYRYTGQEDIIVGTHIAGREHKDLVNQIGFYVNMLPLRNKLKKDQVFSEVLQTIIQSTLGAFEHQMYPFDRLVHELKVVKDLSRNPLFDVVVAFHIDSNHSGNTFVTTDSKNENELEDLVETGIEASKYELIVRFIDQDGRILVQVRYNPQLFKKERIMVMKERFIILLRDIISNKNKEIGNLNFSIEYKKKMPMIELEGGF